MTKPPEPERIDLSLEELEAILERAAREPLGPEDRDKLRAVLESHAWLSAELAAERTSLARLRKFLFGTRKSEKTRDVLGEEKGGHESLPGSGKGPADDSVQSADDSSGSASSKTDESRGEDSAPGHGRNGADAYKGAEHIEVSHPELKVGDICPVCPDREVRKKGRLYALPPSRVVRIIGRAPLQAKVISLERLRCNLCGAVFVADLPGWVSEEKYDQTAMAMIPLLKYGAGLPFNRQEKLEGNLGIPLPAATQWDIVNRGARSVEPVYEELILQAAQGEVLHNDDTPMRILSLMEENERNKEAAKGKKPKERTGIFTSGIVSVGLYVIALFFTGRRHAGENLEAMLAKRAATLSRPLQMCDGLDRNLPKELATIVSNCLVHARRNFVDVAENHPVEVRYVLERLGAVYRNDAIAREKEMSPDERLEFHRAQSSPLMDGLKKWMVAQFDEKRIEPNSDLGDAISYMLARWERLTRFLEIPGAPLDNNVVERSLKRAIVHRKNSLFYKTQRGAVVGDIFMSLIHTAQLHDVNALDYLTELLRHPGAVATAPAKWMPWNYQDAVARAALARA